jgi:hypothetical protein
MISKPTEYHINNKKICLKDLKNQNNLRIFARSKIQNKIFIHKFKVKEETSNS